MDFVDVETKTGVRAPFQHLPASKNVALKFHIPTGLFYSPFVSQSTLYEAAPPRCSKCMAVIHPYAVKNKNIRKWACSFCGTQNPLTLDVGNHTSEEYIEGKVGNCGLVFIIDTCISQDEMIGLKSTLVKTIQKLPRNIHVGLITYNRVVSIYDFSENHHRFYSFNGHKRIQFYIQNIKFRKFKINQESEILMTLDILPQPYSRDFMSHWSKIWIDLLVA